MSGLLFDDVARFLGRFVVMSQHQVDACTLWVAHTHAIDAADSTPYLAVTSAEKRSGKTRLREVLELLVRVPLSASNISDAALFRAIANLGPTVLLDEADAIFKAKDREDLRGMLNAGYRRGNVVYRMGGNGKTVLESFPVFSAKALFGIGDFLPDTLADRSVSIRMERRTRDEPVERFRRRDTEADGLLLNQSLADWIEPQIEWLHSMRPHLPEELDDRAQDSIMPATNTRSSGASPTVAYAMWMSPLFAYRTARLTPPARGSPRSSSRAPSRRTRRARPRSERRPKQSRSEPASTCASDG
ncbi:MAG TPA: DUF3631 domain-containing protein [Gaiellaceae bacterium]